MLKHHTQTALEERKQGERETVKRGRGCFVCDLAVKKMTSAPFGATTLQSTAGQNHKGEQKNRGRERRITGNKRDNGNQMMKRSTRKENKDGRKVQEGEQKGVKQHFQQPPHSHQNLLDSKITVEL